MADMTRERLDAIIERNTSVWGPCSKDVADLIAAVEELVGALEESRKAIASLDEDALGMNSDGDPDVPGGMRVWPIRDELLHNINATLSRYWSNGNG